VIHREATWREKNQRLAAFRCSYKELIIPVEAVNSLSIGREKVKEVRVD
jgi:hypothetical protein